MAIRFVAVEPGAAKPGEAEALNPEADRLPGDEAGSDGLDPVAEAGEDEPRHPASPRTVRKARLRSRPAASAPSEADPADEASAPGEDPVAPEAAPLLFSDLPAHPRPGARARKNRHGFG